MCPGSGGCTGWPKSEMPVDLEIFGEFSLSEVEATGTLMTNLELKHSFESTRMESWLEILYNWAFITPIVGSWQVVSKIQKHTVDYFQPAYFCSQQKRTSLVINSNHVQNRHQQINSAYLF